MDLLLYEKIETGLANLSFIFLFFSMISYWVYLSGNLSTKSNYSMNNLNIESQLINSNSETLEYQELQGFVKYTKTINFQKSNPFLKLGQIGVSGANLSLFIFLSLRWIHSGHFPLSNLYESLLFLCWALTFCHLILNYFTKFDFLWIGSITSPTALLINGFANFSLPTEMQRSTALVPALQSNWLMMHVTVMILSYAALIFGCLLSIGFLILTYPITNQDYENIVKSQKVTLLDSSLSEVRFKWAQNLDNLSYRFLGFGFPLLTIGILSGAVWANEAWGSYWSWDPKETWALLTWLIFAIYLHTRITKNWQGKKPAFLASIGFFVVWVCYLGVNLLGEGLHSYGWVVTS